MSSLAYQCYNTTIGTLKSMADKGVFRAIGRDTLRGVNQASVVGRWRPRITEERGSGNQGENQIPLPGIIVTYVSHNRPPSAGENDMDDGIVTLIIQIVDRLDRSSDNNAESYFRWMEDIREVLQANPFGDLGSYYGEVYLTHVSDQVGPENSVYLFDEMRLASQVSCFTRSRRDKGVRSYGR